MRVRQFASDNNFVRKGLCHRAKFVEDVGMGYFGKILRSYGSMPLVNNGLRDGKLPWATFVRNVMRVGLEETVT